jgi:hypothetical protein
VVKSFDKPTRLATPKEGPGIGQKPDDIMKTALEIIPRQFSSWRKTWLNRKFQIPRSTILPHP